MLEQKNAITVNKIGILVFLAMLYVTIDITSNVLVYKIVKLDFFILPGGIFIYPLLFLLGDIIAEVYGYKLARLILIIDILCNFIFAIAAALIINLPSPSTFHTELAYKLVLGHLFTQNLSIAVAVLIGALINAHIITKWKALLMGRYFWLRSIGASAIGEAVMLILAVFLLFIGRMPMSQIIKLILSDYSFRMLYAIVGAFPANLIVNILKKHEGIEKIETKFTHVNPFKKNKKL
jgi:uncharacterized integral membrane protein (TIGR00697 family)